jgi:hypothetical protein
MRVPLSTAMAAAVLCAGRAARAGDEPAKGVRFVDLPFERALETAREAKKPVFVYFTLDG